MRAAGRQAGPDDRYAGGVGREAQGISSRFERRIEGADDELRNLRLSGRTGTSDIQHTDTQFCFAVQVFEQLGVQLITMSSARIFQPVCSMKAMFSFAKRMA